MPLKIEALREICSLENIEVTTHAAKRLEQGGISVGDIISCVKTGEIIEQYPTDYPFPSCLILGMNVKNVPIHAVIGTNLETLWIVTAYFPNLSKWESDLKTRKENES